MNTNRPPKRPPLPFVFVNMAMTADGKIATTNRAVSSFGSPKDHGHLLLLRSSADAVMTGARTVDLNPVTLGPGPAKYRRLRQLRGLDEYNLRIVVTRTASLDPKAEIFRHRFSPIIILTTQAAGAHRLQHLRKVADEVHICGREQINFRRALEWLRRERKVQRLLCEGGGTLNDALFREGLVNELHLTVCPLIFGGRAAPTIADGVGAPGLKDAATLRLRSAKRKGAEMFLVYEVAPRRPA